MPISKPDYQLRLPLELEEMESGQQPLSPEEIRLRSETARMALNHADVAWKDEYLNLVEGGWNWRVAAYIAWASTPKDGRIPKTQDELATQHLSLTSDRQISEWRRKNPSIDQMIASLQSSPLWEHRASYYKALDKGAKKAGDDYKFYKHLQLALELLGDYVSKSEIEAKLNQQFTGELSKLSFKEKLKLAGLDTSERLADFIQKMKAEEEDIEEREE